MSVKKVFADFDFSKYPSEGDESRGRFYMQQFMIDTYDIHSQKSWKSMKKSQIHKNFKSNKYLHTNVSVQFR